MTYYPLDQLLRRLPTPVLVSLLSLGLAVGATVSCAAPKAAPAAPPADLAAQGEGYQVYVPPASVAAGQEGTLAVKIHAREGFKVNTEYPSKVKLEPAPDGLDLPQREFRQEDAQLIDPHTLAFTVPLRARRAGSYRVHGETRFGVCTAERCLIKTVQFAAQIKVD
jgi:hypothetical protein